jgi:hypothetical protein
MLTGSSPDRLERPRPREDYSAFPFFLWSGGFSRLHLGSSDLVNSNKNGGATLKSPSGEGLH